MDDIIIINKSYTGLNPVQAGYQACEKKHSFGPAVRTFWLLHYVMSGNGFFVREGKRSSVGAGDIFVIPPYVETYYEADEIKPWEYIWVGFTCDGELPFPLEEHVIHSPRLGKIFDEILKCASLENGRSAYISGKLWELFADLLEGQKQKADYIEKAVSCMKSEYIRGITVNEIARRLSLNRSYFSDMFKKKMGISPQKYLNNIRIEKAATLMVEHGQSPTTAAFSTGYNDVYSFSKMFKRHFGVSPREYIKLNKKLFT